MKVFSIRNKDGYNAFKNKMADINILRESGRSAMLGAFCEKATGAIRHPFFAYSLHVESIQRDRYFKEIVALTL